jgi:broad specificity phosphatase PhoE
VSAEAGSATGPASRPLDDGPLADRQMPDDTALWLVRHGETEWSRSGQHTGRTDLPLTPKGERQAQAVPALLGDVAGAYVMCSPMGRALRSADLAGLHVDRTDPELVEWDYGEYEGMTTAEIRKQVPDWSIWTHGAPGGESPAQVQARADRVLRSAAEHLADGPVILVGHGHFSRVLGVRWIGLPVAAVGNLLLGTAAPCKLGAQHGVSALVHWNLPNPAA